MALEASFKELQARLSTAREAFTDLRVAVVEDSPRKGAPVLVDQLGDAVTDLLGWLEEAAEAAASGLREAERPRDLEGAEAALLACAERCQQVAQRFGAGLLCCDRIVEIYDLGRERGREWRLWSGSVQEAIHHGQEGLLGAFEALFGCFREIAELSGAGAASVRTTSIGQQIAIVPEPKVVREKTAEKRDATPRVRRAG